jgi:hypothetical protein
MVVEGACGLGTVSMNLIVSSEPPQSVAHGQPAWYARGLLANVGRTAVPCRNLMGEPMDQEAIIQYVTDTFPGVMVWRPADGPGTGDTFIYYDPQHDLDLTRNFPFATIVTKDYGDFDNTSNLNRPGVFRLNIGVSRDTFRAVVGYPPEEFGAKSDEYDFAALDRLMPHPVYAPQSWVCVLNPSPETFEAVKPLLAEAYSRAASRHAGKQTDRD